MYILLLYVKNMPVFKYGKIEIPTPKANEGPSPTGLHDKLIEIMEGINREKFRYEWGNQPG